MSDPRGLALIPASRLGSVNGNAIMPLKRPDWQDFPTKTGRTLGELAERNLVLLEFVRHNGCTFCRVALDELARLRPALREDGVEIVVAHHGDDRNFRDLLDRYGLGDVVRIHDPARRLYRIFDLGHGGARELFGPEVMKRGIEALLKGYGVGVVDGHPLQMSGSFVLHQGRVLIGGQHPNISHHPDYMLLVERARANEENARARASR